MIQSLTRRHLLERALSCSAGAAGLSWAGCLKPIRAEMVNQSPKPVLKKALLYAMLPQSWSVDDKFKLVADLGYDGVEILTTPEEDVEVIRAGAEKAGVRIHSVMIRDHWDFPLSSDNPDVVKKSLDCLTQSLHNAKAFGADTVLLVPAVVTPQTRYAQAWERSQRQIRTVLPLARELGIIIAIENVGNRFLLSPLEFVRYIDEFNDPFLQAYFDVGNCIYLGGYPQDWIPTLGPRIKKIHLKDCKAKEHQFVSLREGDVAWPLVRQALADIGFSGFCTLEPNYHVPEAKKNPRAYFKRMAKQIDLIFDGK